MRATFFAACALLCFTLHAQLKADFTMNKTAGCSPLLVTFTNTSSGTSAATVYRWSFGNGNASSLKNTAAVYEGEQIYTVTLTATDGAQTASVSKQVTVYKKPGGDFSVSASKGCVPFAVNFTATATAGDGTVGSYYWDFGDGFTQSTTAATTSHTYTAAQQAGVSLTVINSFGCYATLQKNNLLDVKPLLKADFGADKKFLCRETDSVHFINNSSGPGSLTYVWDFGDGTTSTETNPVYAFNKRGSYTVKLTVASSEGCTATTTQTAYLNVANFTSDFTVPPLLCQNTNVSFTNTSAPAPLASAWFVDGLPAYSFQPALLNYAFSTGPHSVKLKNTFGTCVDSAVKQVVVNPVPKLTGFVADIAGKCGSPVVVNFKDTTPTAVQWQWYFGDYTPQVTQQTPSHTYAYDDNFSVTLTVKDAAGCSATVYKQVLIRKPRVEITSPDVALNGSVQSCGPLNARFSTTSSEPITDYSWDFGDGTTSAQASPVHYYGTMGTYYVSLNYTTANGCKGQAKLTYPVAIHTKPRADFTVSTNTVCGNLPVTFTNTSTTYGSPTFYTYTNWNMGNGYFAAFTNQTQSYTHQFADTGTYTVSLIMTDLVCADTMIKTAYVKVLPPFPKISGYTNTCDGTRGLVTFTQTSRYANTWTWDFGDGTSLTPTTNQPQVQHLYSASDRYKVVLSSTNGQCTVRDSVYAMVLLKQHPVLSADKTEVCSRDDYLKLTVSNMEDNVVTRTYGYGYGFYPWEHSDGSYALNVLAPSSYANGVYNTIFWNFTPGKQGLNVSVLSGGFNCRDTSNTIPLIVKGAVPGFKVLNNPCATGNTLYLQDTTAGMYGVQPVSWQWNFGDGKPPVTYNHGGQINYTYTWPGQYYVTLTVTDAAGCVSLTQQQVLVGSASLKAAFTTSATQVSPGTTVTFTNTSVSSDPGQTSYLWLFGDGTQTASFNASKTYTQPGSYTVRLIATNAARGCTDTAAVTILVKYVNAAFTYQNTFITAAKCPPVLVRFSNTSNNISKILWDFGDGATSTQFNPSHVYTAAGKYFVTVQTFSDNGTVYTTLDSVVIGMPAARLSADALTGCTVQQTTFKASAQAAVGYWWDFGDGAVQQTTDSSASHNYVHSGVYTPRLLVQDNNGCAVSANLQDSIVIDSLSVVLAPLPATVCAPRQLSFSAAVFSAVPGRPLRYRWDFGTANAADTSAGQSPVFTFSQPGTYIVHLTVWSAFGCIKDVSGTVVAYQGLGGIINGPAEICQGQSAQFSGATALPGQPQWQWTFWDGTTSTAQAPPPKKYDTPGTYPVQLAVSNNGCTDSLTANLLVNPLPAGILSQHEASLCKGASVAITAANGAGYTWSPVAGLNTTTGSTVIASPPSNVVYTVQAVSEKGCLARDSIRLNVVQPFTLILPAQAAMCKGGSVQLTASGADSYQWINNTGGLSATNVANPFASPVASAVYTVVGRDAQRCFSDTAGIAVTVHPLPAVDAGPGAEILAGGSYQLLPTTSNDVTAYVWSPAKYLGCTTCAAPLSAPLEPVLYTLTASNAFGCSASDTVSVRLLCGQSRIYIPNAFTPNNDGRNDKFLLTGQGIRLVKWLRIYDRWGGIIFERTNFNVNDQNAAWDGKQKGQPVPAGSYVYLAELSCNESSYLQKGTVTVIY